MRMAGDLDELELATWMQHAEDADDPTDAPASTGRTRRSTLSGRTLVLPPTLSELHDRQRRCDELVDGVNVFNAHEVEPARCREIEEACGIASCTSAMDIVISWVDGSREEQVRTIRDFVPVAHGGRVFADDHIALAVRHARTTSTSRLIVALECTWAGHASTTARVRAIVP